MKFTIFLNCNFLILILSLIYVKCDENCGKINKKSDRIVNGRDLGYQKYPWFAALVLANNNKQLVCGGSLIGPRHVLTAAHCFKPYFESVKNKKISNEDIFTVKLGISNICITEPVVQVFSTQEVYIHEKYMDEMPYYDIALLVLDNKATDFTPVCLPEAKYTSNNRTNFPGTIVGLGREASNAWKTPCTVKEARIPIQPDSVCIKMLKTVKQNASKFHGDFCAGYAEGGTDTCQGDSGGPLQVFKEDTNNWMLLGITSFGYGCAQEGMYGFYTDVSHYINWIEEKIKSEQKLTINNNENNNESEQTSQQEIIELSTVPSLKHRPIQRKHKLNNRKRNNNNLINLLLNL